MSAPRTYVIGGGIAGLSAAVALTAAGRRVTVLEGAAQAGGRCRSYLDPQLGLVIDNGNHLVFSGNKAVHDYLETLNAEGGLVGPEEPEYRFVDVETGQRWTIRPNPGPIGWWVGSKARRVPGTKAADYLALLPLMWAGRDKRVGEVAPTKGALWHRLLQPVLLAALNTRAEDGSARLAGAVIRESLARGGRAYRPRIAHPTLAEVFVDPAIAFLESRGGEVRLGRRVRGLRTEGGRLAGLTLPDGEVALGPEDSAVLALPPWAARELLPELSAPDKHHAIINGHFRIAPPPGLLGEDPVAMYGVIGGTVEWVFAFADRVSVTISGADRLVDMDREALAALMWRDVVRVLDLPPELPPWQVVKERRATFAATPEQDAKRPGPATAYANLVLAGDWTDTGLPATLEGAVRSGQTAAKLLAG